MMGLTEDNSGIVFQKSQCYSSGYLQYISLRVFHFLNFFSDYLYN